MYAALQLMQTGPLCKVKYVPAHAPDLLAGFVLLLTPSRAVTAKQPRAWSAAKADV